MAVKMRLMRIGRRNRPFYRIAVMDARTKRSGKTIEVIGHYDPLAKDPSKTTVVKKDRAEYWLKVGAVPTETVVSILRKHDVAFPVKAKRRKRSKSGGGPS